MARAEEAAVDDEMLAGVASEKEDDSDDSDYSSVREVVFSTPISPSRGTMLPPAKPTTPEATRKRSFILVHRTPEKPREAPRRTHDAFKYDYPRDISCCYDTTRAC